MIATEYRNQVAEPPCTKPQLAKPLGSRHAPERLNERLDVEVLVLLLLLLRGEAVDGVAEVDEVEESDGGLHVPLGVRLLVVAPRVARVEQGAVLMEEKGPLPPTTLVTVHAVMIFCRTFLTYRTDHYTADRCDQHPNW